MTDQSIGDKDQDLVLEVLRSVMADPDAPAAARTQAARTLAEVKGMVGRHAAPPDLDTKPSSIMSRAELEAELRQLRSTKDS